MKLKYQTGIIAFIQFAIGTALGFTNQLYSIISGCTHQSNDCVSNAIVSLTLIVLIAIWFGFIAILGYAAQDRRSRRLAKLLIVAELAVAGAAFIDASHYPNILGLITSLIDLGLAFWVIYLAWRLYRAKGGRVVSGGTRKRQRRHTIS